MAARILHVGGIDADQQALRSAVAGANLGEVATAPVPEALKQVTARAVDLVVVDLMQSSNIVLAIMRAAAPTPTNGSRVPLIVAAPQQASDRIQVCLQRGAEDFLLTPYQAQHPTLITRRIELCLLRRRARDFSVRMLSNVTDPNDTAVLQMNGTPKEEKSDRSQGWNRFIPHEFLDNLDRKSIDEVQLGDHVQREMTVFFSDIRDFTSLSEKLTPRENFSFLTNYLKNINPVIRAQGGFVDKYLGDGVMALFPGEPENGLKAAVEMQKVIARYNDGRRRAGYVQIRVGIGLHRGSLILGTIGESERMHTTVIADAVNLASRVEGMTKTFGVGLLVSGTIVDGLPERHQFLLRHLGAIKAKGKTQSVEVYECFNNDPKDLLDHKERTLADFNAAMAEFRKGMFLSAGKVFAYLAERNSDDTVAAYYRDRCSWEVVSKRQPGRFDGAEQMEVK